MNIVAVNIRRPSDDVLGMPELFRFMAEFRSHCRLETGFSGRRTYGAIQLRSSQSVEEAAIHGRAVEGPQSSTEGIRQDCPAAEFLRHSAKARRNPVERLVPRNPLPCLLVWDRVYDPVGRGGEAPRPRRRPLRHNSPHGIQHPIRRIHAIEIFRHLGTQKPPLHRMLRIALNLGGPPVLHSDEQPGGIRTIVRTRGMDDLLHRFDYTLVITWAGMNENRINRRGPRTGNPVNPLQSYFSSRTSFSLALLISSIFLISSSVSFWISSRERFSSSSVIFLSFSAFLIASLPSRRILRTAVRCSSSTRCRCFTMSCRRSCVRAGTGTRMSVPSFIGFKPMSPARIDFSIAPSCEGSKGCTVINCASGACTCAIWFNGICEP